MIGDVLERRTEASALLFGPDSGANVVGWWTRRPANGCAALPFAVVLVMICADSWLRNVVLRLRFPPARLPATVPRRSGASWSRRGVAIARR